MSIKRVLIVGWDGAGWSVLDPMLKAGQLPVLERLIAEGVRGPLRSTIPTHSYTAWSSFMTGKNPGKHGIYTFGRYDRGQAERLLPTDRRDIAAETFPEVLARHGRRIGMAHVPLSFPPVSVDGFWISGMVIPEGAAYTHPPELQSRIETYAGEAFADRVGWNVLENEWERLFSRAEEITQAQIRGLFYLLDRYEWDLFTYVFVSPDRLQHAAMRLLDESHPDFSPELAERYRPRFVEHIQWLDKALGETLNQLGEETLVLVISDHGFRSCWQGWSVETWLRQRRYLKVRSDYRKLRRLLRRSFHLLVRAPEKRQLWAQRGGQLVRDSVEWGRTRAYVASVAEQGVRINLQGREPRGTVPPSEYERLRLQLQDEIQALRDLVTGRPLVNRVYFREELFQGDKLAEAPDLIFEFAPGVALPTTNSTNNDHLTKLGWKSGEHDIQGILVAKGPCVPSGKYLTSARLIDIAPTVLHVLGAPVPEDMDGNFLAELFTDRDLGQIQFESPRTSEVARNVYSEEEQRLVEEHLRSLGYL